MWRDRPSEKKKKKSGEIYLQKRKNESGEIDLQKRKKEVER
jgi:hypothetical protein